ncbi:MAG: nucleotidyltransferase domain-containing protein [Candidatus Tectomicrobia bacterium]|uniref:Nucleotidyltransferase domain-containing protein n=1 Tax=Tectimicrobiota bacterium TaxID=2528274 RepID=A0A932GPT5_UNCTE|nr:nucleotidyltransferase domain-containing protein [Candidatus Tectomicrobia bacterium]
MAGRELTVEKIREALRPLFQRPGLQLALVFGSRSAGRAGKGSDLDLAVLGDKPVDLVKVTNEVIKLLHLNEVDVVDLRRASPLLAMESIQQFLSERGLT